jgi:hypothetical protein
MPRNVIVVGMARSGTSLTASIFVKKGYFVADDYEDQLQAANRFNRNGYWELEELKEADASILEAVGFQHHNTWTKEAIEPRSAEAIFDLEHRAEHLELVNRYAEKQPWIWKDPRFCYTLAYWWPLMDPETTGVLLVTRNPSEIWRSFVRAKWGNATSDGKAAFVRRVEDHIEFARATIRRFDIPHIEVDYGDYAVEPKATAEKIGSFFGIDLEPGDLGYESKYNSSAPRGYIGYVSERVGRMLPSGVRRSLKNALPKFLHR